MNKRIETLLSNTEVKATDYFNLVNIFDCSTLSVCNDKNRTASMKINEFRKIHKGYEFLQKCTDTHFDIKEQNIESVSGKMLDEVDTFLINVKMVDGESVNICIFHTDTNEKTEEREHYSETDVLSLKEYFEDEKHNPLMLMITDAFGFTTRFNGIASLSLMEEDEDFRYILQVTNGMGASVEFPLVEDSCNEIYIKESGFADTIFIRPYGQPFMEIKILVSKTEEKTTPLTVVK